jgi:vacuolar-type H+-ATPase subunit I/STV1
VLGFEAGRSLPYFVSFNRSEVQSIIDKIRRLAPQFNEEINEINRLKSDVRGNLESFKKEIHELVKWIDADKQIKGKCKLCP